MGGGHKVCKERFVTTPRSLSPTFHGLRNFVPSAQILSIIRQSCAPLFGESFSANIADGKEKKETFG